MRASRRSQTARPERPALERMMSTAGVPSALAFIACTEIQKAYADLQDQFPPVLSLKQAAALAQLAPSTLKRKVSEGCFKRSVKRGKPLRFFRDLFVQEFMNL